MAFLISTPTVIMLIGAALLVVFFAMALNPPTKWVHKYTGGKKGELDQER